jgi:peptidoglycan/LPS O-acetylase OafA/YrhL
LPRLNNFDLIRLLAALQVFVMHAFTTLGLSMAPIVAASVTYAALHIGWTGMQGLAVETADVALLAIGSWYFIERPAPGLKQETRFSDSEARALGSQR